MNFIQKRTVENFKRQNYVIGLQTFRMKDKNKKYHVQLVSPVSQDLRVHYIKTLPPSACNLIYFDEDDPNKNCQLCDMPHPKYKTQPAWLVRMYIGYCFELLGTKDVTKKGSEYEVNPLCIIVVPGNGKGRNFKPFNDAIEEGELLESIWNFEDSTELGGFVTPSKASVKKLGEQFDLDVVKQLQAEWAQKTDQEVQSIMLSAWANVKWDHPDMVASGFVNPYPKQDKESETVEDDVQQEPVTSAHLD